MGLEVLDQVPDLDAIVVPVGGGGLIAGMENPQRWIFGRGPDSLFSSYLGPYFPPLSPCRVGGKGSTLIPPLLQ